MTGDILVAEDLPHPIPIVGRNFPSSISYNTVVKSNPGSAVTANQREEEIL